MTRIVILCLLFVGVFYMPNRLHAQTGGQPADEPASEATSTIEEARLARDAGDYDTALSKLEAALHAQPSNGLILYERILTLEAMGELDLALQIITDRRDEIITHPEVNDLAVVEQRLISARDAAANGSSGDTDATNGETATKGDTTGTGDSAVGDADAGSGDTDSSTAVVAKSGDGGGSNTGAVVALTAGGVAIVGGTVLLILANADAADLECAGISPASDCAADELEPNVTSGEYDDRQSSITTRRIIGGVAVGLGAVAVGWGIYGLLSGGSESEGSAEARVQPGVTILDGGITVGLSGRFQ